MDKLFNELDAIVDSGWAKIKQGRYWKYSLEQPITRELYQQVMLQVYHYTRFNSINQAACAFSADPSQTTLLRFVYKHALEELGHEKWSFVTWNRLAPCLTHCLHRCPHPGTDRLSQRRFHSSRAGCPPGLQLLGRRGVRAHSAYPE